MNEVFQALNVYFAFAAMLLNTAFIVLVLTRSSRSMVTVTFLLTCLAAIVWNLGIFMTYFAPDGAWFFIALIGSPLIPAFLFHLINALVNPGARAGGAIVAAYTFSGMLAISSFLAIFHPLIRRFVDGPAWNVYFLALLLPFTLAGAAMLARAMRDARDPRERSRHRAILVAVLIGTGLGLTDLIQIFGVPVPKLGHAGSVIYSAIIAGVIVRNRRSYDLIEQMRTKLALFGELTAGIAHEIRSPLGSIKGAARLLAAGAAAPAGSPEREYLDLIREEIARLDGILASFRDLTRPIETRSEPLAVNDLIERTVRLAQTAGLSVAVRTELAADLPAVPADASLLKQVFLNLIRNAAEAGAGELVIATAAAPHGVRISFRDRGRGIAPELREKIFEPFFTTKSTGIGLGLAICRRIVEAHGGRIEAPASVNPGAEFVVTLPA